MALIRTLARMDAEGKIELPKNIRLALGLKEHDVVELRVVRQSSKSQQITQQVILSKRGKLPVGL